MTDQFEGNYDCMVIGAHPDDAELCCGGTIAKLTKEGKKVVLVDLTRGEMGTRGNPELREEEAQAAAKILGVSDRINLEMRDGFIRNDEESIYKIVSVVRKYRPRMILMHPWFERHPDHENTHYLVRDALFKCGLRKFETKDNGILQETYRTRRIFSYMQAYQFPKPPDFFVDISDVHHIKIQAIEAFSSQVFVPGKYENEPRTRLASPEFMEELVARARYLGGLNGVKYAEAYLSVEPVILDSLSKLL
ncbi:MAG: bacillithiol biosynthesis deacetylase BshB1 [Candidatus Kapabacteria bacterium]|nr:bacillithiol biosynthesis deacetylase BshB1 [Ignavibacteriota bacterium]MCW5886243.1 bacillithiol biosynthesis deacetylase BshB1 [Candidatus Kapabacteria bacterium]